MHTHTNTHVRITNDETQFRLIVSHTNTARGEKQRVAFVYHLNKIHIDAFSLGARSGHSRTKNNPDNTNEFICHLNYDVCDNCHYSGGKTHTRCETSVPFALGPNHEVTLNKTYETHISVMVMDGSGVDVLR